VDGFDEFYGGTHRRLLRAVVAMTGDVEEAQDCLQESYIRAAARWKHVSNLGNPEAWVRRVALNLALDGHRRQRVRRRWFASARPADPVTGPDAVSLDVVRAVRALPPEERDVIVRHHLLDMSVTETARELGRSESTCKTQLVRGRARLAELLHVKEELTP
jgi:RNA polymerase sigma-70 factor (ECF subfamily)